MNLEILSVGDELKVGALVDTNAAYIAQEAILAGLEVGRHTTVGDTLPLISEVLREIGGRAEVVVVTGGLGPTLDDLTRDAAADAANVSLTFDGKVFEEIKAYFAKIAHQIPESNRRQAFLPEGGEFLPNPIGTAPGFTLKIGDAHFFFCPGVPREMKKMLHEQVFPRIQKLATTPLHPLQSATLFTFGYTEAVLGEHLENWEGDYPRVKFGTRASFPGIEVKLYAERGGEEALAKAKERVKTEIGKEMFISEKETIAMVVTRLLKEQKRSLSVLEIGHGGKLADWLTENPASTPFLATLSPEQIASFLSTTLDLGNPSTYAQLAKALAHKSQTTHGLILHGIGSEQEAEASGIALGKVFVGIYADGELHTYVYTFKHGSPDSRRKFFPMFALDLLRRILARESSVVQLLGVRIDRHLEK